jgi:hypothetical protein
MSWRRDQIAAVAQKWRCGELSLEQAIEGFVCLFAARGSPELIASMIARDEILRERFYELFVKLTPPS